MIGVNTQISKTTIPMTATSQIEPRDYTLSKTAHCSSEEEDYHAVGMSDPHLAAPFRMCDLKNEPGRNRYLNLSKRMA